MLQAMGSQSVGYNWDTELKWTEPVPAGSIWGCLFVASSLVCRHPNLKIYINSGEQWGWRVLDKHLKQFWLQCYLPRSLVWWQILIWKNYKFLFKIFIFFLFFFSLSGTCMHIFCSCPIVFGILISFFQSLFSLLFSFWGFYWYSLKHRESLLTYAQ